TGGGMASLQFEHQINFHFTGDIHAITSAHNAISAQIDNEVFFETDLDIDKDQIVWPRCLDINERALKDITIHYPTKPHLDHKSRFIITVASELMSIISIVTSIKDLKVKLDQTLVAYSTQGTPIYIKDLGITDAIVILLQPALLPNMTLTLENTPAFVHGGAFANIAHGTTTVRALQDAISIADYAICETGFGADLGFEKFIHLIASEYSLIPDHLVLVISIPMLKALSQSDENDITDGLQNLLHHIQWIRKTGVPITVALNQFADTTDDEIQFLTQWCQNEQVDFGISNGFAEGGNGCLSLAECIINQTPTQHFSPFYTKESSLLEKLNVVTAEIYGASDIILSDTAKEQLNTFIANGWDKFPICIAKSPFFLVPQNDTSTTSVYIKSLEVRTGAQFIVVYADNVIAMPALPRDPNAKHLFISDDGVISNDK
ncbi:MAG: formate--tetrahydrofolate ligase, partial [Culicoidibacterales bacterium]